MILLLKLNYDGPLIAELSWSKGGMKCQRKERKWLVRSINTSSQELSVNEHPESTITIEHLRQHNISKEDKDYYFFRGDNNKKEDVRI